MKLPVHCYNVILFDCFCFVFVFSFRFITDENFKPRYATWIMFVSGIEPLFKWHPSWNESACNKVPLCQIWCFYTNLHDFVSFWPLTAGLLGGTNDRRSLKILMWSSPWFSEWSGRSVWPTIFFGFCLVCKLMLPITLFVFLWNFWEWLSILNLYQILGLLTGY
jgi:hypothetical protein